MSAACAYFVINLRASPLRVRKSKRVKRAFRRPSGCSASAGLGRLFLILAANFLTLIFGVLILGASQLQAGPRSVATKFRPAR